MQIFILAGKFKNSGFSCFNFFLFNTCNTCLESFWQHSFKITILGEPFDGTPQPNPCSHERRLHPKSPALLFQCPYPPASAGMPDILRHSLLEDCSITWHFRSRSTNLSDILSFRFQEMCISELS